VTTYTTPVLKHIAGSSFGLLLESEETCPIQDPTLVPMDTGAWGIDLVLVGRAYRVAVPGVWLSSFEPWQMSFQAAETTAWPEGEYEVRLAYTTPPGEAPRRFEQPLKMMLEVCR
jgi:hypothetical protein